MNRSVDKNVIGNFSAVYIGPDSIKTPSGTAFDKHTVEKSMGQSEKLALITEEAHDDEPQCVVVHVNFALGCDTPCLPHHSSDQSGRPDSIVLEIVYRVVVVADVTEHKSDQTKQNNKNSPHARTPSGHRCGVKCEVLHETNIKVRKLETNEEKRCAPDEEVVVKHLGVFVGFAAEIAPGRIHLPEVVHPRE